MREALLLVLSLLLLVVHKLLPASSPLPATGTKQHGIAALIPYLPHRALSDTTRIPYSPHGSPYYLSH